MTDPSTEPKPRPSTLAENARLRKLRAVLTRECVRLREEAGTVMPLDFIEAAIRESAK